MKRAIPLAVGAAMVALGALAPAAQATLDVPATPGAAQTAVEDPFLLYMAPNAAPTNTGLTPSSPLPTLEAVETRLNEYDPQSDVEVHIAPGTYLATETTWTTYIDGHSISFMPSGYSYGDPMPTRPVFRGTGGAEYWFRARLTGADQGGTSDLRFYYLRVTEYQLGGLAFWARTNSSDGLMKPAGEGLNGNTVYGMRFDRIGEIHVPGKPGFGGLTLLNSDDNWVRNNHFVELENTYAQRGVIHGIYMAHGADDNLIESNVFSYITGSPIRVRNTSDDNVIRQNTFDHTAYAPSGFFSEWFCYQHCADVNDIPPECGSFGNTFYENTLGPSYPGTTLGQQHRAPADLTEIGPAACVRDSPEPWVRTWDNIRP